ncbi:MAG: (d)CMP kinase [Phycisphaeraceae bacterium]|nr:(d)CMP kinase [Phycisphaeraceae bacterium]MCW5754013.1 (d)CMP kinase [Phycisphaeraceae bacterium]
MSDARAGALLADRSSGPIEVLAPQMALIVTIDGPAGTGKSSVAHALAKRLGLRVLDTGAMYRAAAAIVIDHDLPRDDVEQILARVRDADLHFDWKADPPVILAWLKPMNERIREADVNELVSLVAAMSPLREHMVRKQRLIGKQYPHLVSEGRDQGSVVFPDADVKFFLTADPRERARRRVDQLREQGVIVDPEEMETKLIARDQLDSTRADGPLVKPEGAIELDTTNMTFDEVVDRLEAHVRAVVGDRTAS